MIIQRFTPLKAATKQVKRLISPLSIIVILAIIALTLRLLFLGERPFHHDETDLKNTHLTQSHTRIFKTVGKFPRETHERRRSINRSGFKKRPLDILSVF